MYKFVMVLGIQVLLMLMTAHTVCGQDKRILGSFLYEKETYNYEFSRDEGTLFTFRISRTNDTAASGSVAENSFTDFSQVIFESGFVEQMVSHYGKTDNGLLRDKAKEVFYTVKLRYDVLDDEPVTAYLIQRTDVLKSLLKANTSVFYSSDLSALVVDHYVKRVSVEISDGAIKNLVVKVVENSPEAIRSQSPRKYLEFKNQFPISVSGKFDPEYFNQVNLYCLDCNSIEGLTRYIKLSDLLALDIVLENNKEDYSPSDRTVVLTPVSPIAELKKEKRTRLVEVTAFSDFAGLDHEEPNGLIQIEARRKLLINTRYQLLGAGKKKNEMIASKVDLGTITNFRKDLSQSTDTKSVYTFDVIDKDSKKITNAGQKFEVNNNKFRSTYYNWFGSLEPRLLFSKLDENNRFVGSDLVVNNQVDPVTLYQYQLASFGMNLQVYRLSFPQLKFSWNVLHAGIYWFRTRLEGGDAETSIPLNSHYSQIGSSFQFRPDSRWGAVIGFDYIKPSIWNPEYSLSSTHALHQPYFDGFLRTNEYDKLFFRFRWTYEHKQRENNFLQIQLGYSINLFGSGESGVKGGANK